MFLYYLHLCYSISFLLKNQSYVAEVVDQSSIQLAPIFISPTVWRTTMTDLFRCLAEILLFSCVVSLQGSSIS